MTQPIDVTYVELRARGEKETARDVKKALQEIERDVDRAADGMESSIEEMLRTIVRDIERIDRTLQDMAEEQVDQFEKLGNTIGSDISAGSAVARRAIDGLADSAERDLERISREARRAGASLGGIGHGGGGIGGIGDGVGGLTGGLGGAGKIPGAVAGLGSTVASIGSSSGYLLVALSGLIPVIIALVGALSQLAGGLLLLPAAFAAIVAIAAPLIMSFQGIGDAVSALASGDLEKISEAMKNLSPSAQAFARELNALRKPLKNLRMDVQEGFFREFRGDLTAMINSLLPTLRSGLSGVSGALGRLASDFAELLGANDIVEVIGDVFESTERIIDGLNPKIVDFVGVLFGGIERGLPLLERAADALGGLIDDFTNWLSGSLQGGSFESFVEGAFETFKNLWDLVGAFGNLFNAIFGDAGDEGNDFIQSLTEMINKMAEFFRSAEGQEILQDLLDTVKGISTVLPYLADAFKWVAMAAGFFLNNTIKIYGWLRIAGEAVIWFFRNLDDWAKTAWSAVQDFFSMLGDWLKNVGQWFSDAWDDTKEFFDKLVERAEKVPGEIEEFLRSLPGRVNAIIQQMFDDVTTAFGYGLGTIVGFFMALPSRLMAGAELLWTFISDTFVQVRDRAIGLVLTTVDRIVTFFIELPGRVWDAAYSIGERVGSIFVNLYNRTRDTVSNLVNRVIQFFRDMPGRARDAASSLPDRILSILRDLAGRAVDAGRNVMEGVARGIRNGVNSAIEAAKRAARNILQGFWDALGIGSPSKVAAATVGKPIMQGVGVGVTDEAPQLRDVINRSINGVLPTDFGTRQHATGSAITDQSINFGEGAISISFSGVVPTEDEARQVGSTVGNSIAQTLARQNMRIAVRTV